MRYILGSSNFHQSFKGHEYFHNTVFLLTGNNRIIIVIHYALLALLQCKNLSWKLNIFRF